MIAAMVRGLAFTVAASIAVALALAACGASTSQSDEPTTAAEKQRREAAASGDTEAERGSWSGWRYTGDRASCFFVIGRRCFKTEDAACAAAACKPPSECKTTGVGPAAVSCSAPTS